MSKETNLSLAHTTWNCKYHVVFAPKYRRKVFFHQKRLEVGAILRSLCEWKNVIIHEAEVCPDHVHMLISIPPKLSVIGKNKRAIAESIANQLKEDREMEQMTIQEITDPFKK